nr:hypothetical protein Itr_chr03CG16490 [Ipomoea trifida]
MFFFLPNLLPQPPELNITATGKNLTLLLWLCRCMALKNLSFSSLLTPVTISSAPSCAVGDSRSKDRSDTVSRCALR